MSLNKRLGGEKMAKLDLNKISLTTGIYGGVLYVACYLLFLAIPGFMFSVAKNIFHGIQMTNQFIPSFGGFLLGLVYAFVGSLLLGGLFVLVYNMVNKK